MIEFWKVPSGTPDGIETCHKTAPIKRKRFGSGRPINEKTNRDLGLFFCWGHLQCLALMFLMRLLNRAQYLGMVLLTRQFKIDIPRFFGRLTVFSGVRDRE